MFDFDIVLINVFVDLLILISIIEILQWLNRNWQAPPTFEPQELQPPVPTEVEAPTLAELEAPVPVELEAPIPAETEPPAPQQFERPEPEVATRPVFRVFRGNEPVYWETVMEQRPDGTWEILHVDTGLPPASDRGTPSERGRRRYRSGSGDRSLAGGSLML